MSEHTHLSHKMVSKRNIRFSIITISTSRFEKYGNVISPDDAEDTSGNIMLSIVKNEGHEIAFYKLIPDDKIAIQNIIYDTINKEIDIIVTSGGTGLSPDDITIETLKPLFEKKIEGFGEYFRYLSIKEIGSSVILTRSCAGVINKKVVFCLPGSPNAVKLALSKIILPEAHHIISHINRVVKNEEKKLNI